MGLTPLNHVWDITPIDLNIQAEVIAEFEDCQLLDDLKDVQ